MIARARALSKRVRADDRSGERTILDRIDLDIERGEQIALTGRSGAGKSTLLGILATLDDDYEGEVEICGAKLAALGESGRAELRNHKLGFVFQMPHLFAGLDVWQNLTAASWIGGRPLDLARAERLLERVGLAAARHRRVNVLSGGEKQRLSVARALLPRPELLLCDEPTGNLDAQSGGELLDLLAELQREEGLTLLIVTHDPAIVARAKRTLTLVEGRLP
jgi:putative ABC transport system ATP-binding protein